MNLIGQDNHHGAELTERGEKILSTQYFFIREGRIPPGINVTGISSMLDDVLSSVVN